MPELPTRWSPVAAPGGTLAARGPDRAVRSFVSRDAGARSPAGTVGTGLELSRRGKVLAMSLPSAIQSHLERALAAPGRWLTELDDQAAEVWDPFIADDLADAPTGHDCAW